MASIPTTPTTPTTPSTPRTPLFNTKSPTIKRILQESRELASHPDPSLHAAPLDTNLFEWHFTLSGPPSTPYTSGIYHGRIILPPTYPLRPPSFRFLTPSGRFEVNREICLSISGHHEETWQPAWGIRTALCAIRAFMASDARGQIGGLEMNDESRARLARESRSWRCMGCGGRSNEEVLKEREEMCGPQGADARPQDKVPEELRLEYRDDMERGPPTPVAGMALPDRNGPLLAQPTPRSPLPPAGPVANLLARSKPPPSPLRATSSSSSSSFSAPLTDSPAPAPGTSSRPLPPTSAFLDTPASTTAVAGSRYPTPVPATPRVVPPTPTPTMATMPVAGETRGAVQTRARQGVDEGVPEWVDKAIVGLVVALLFMALKKLVS